MSFRGMTGDDAGMWPGVWANLADSPELGEKWDVGVRELTGRLRGLPRPQQIAVMEAIQTFWAHHEKPTDEALALAIRRGPMGGFRCPKCGGKYFGRVGDRVDCHSSADGARAYSGEPTMARAEMCGWSGSPAECGM